MRTLVIQPTVAPSARDPFPDSNRRVPDQTNFSRIDFPRMSVRSMA